MLDHVDSWTVVIGLATLVICLVSAYLTYRDNKQSREAAIDHAWDRWREKIALAAAEDLAVSDSSHSLAWERTLRVIDQLPRPLRGHWACITSEAFQRIGRPGWYNWYVKCAATRKGKPLPYLVAFAEGGPRR